MSVFSSKVGIVSERSTSGHWRESDILTVGDSGLVWLKLELFVMFEVVFVRLVVLFVMFC